jgi:hypothetical protein
MRAVIALLPADRPSWRDQHLESMRLGCATERVIGFEHIGEREAMADQPGRINLLRRHRL